MDDNKARLNPTRKPLMKLRVAIPLMALFFGGALGAHAQYPIDPSAMPPPPPAEPIFNPLRAEKSVEVGLYYMKKHNYDAAIERFQDAAKSKENFAQPYLLMGEAYEKKGDKEQAVKAFETYLKLLPSAPDSDKIRKRITKLNEEIEKEARRGSG